MRSSANCTGLNSCNTLSVKIKSNVEPGLSGGFGFGKSHLNADPGICYGNKRAIFRPNQGICPLGSIPFLGSVAWLAESSGTGDYSATRTLTAMLDAPDSKRQTPDYALFTLTMTCVCGLAPPRKVSSRRKIPTLTVKFALCIFL